MSNSNFKMVLEYVQDSLDHLLSSFCHQVNLV